MRHVPHLVVGAPWGDETIGLNVVQWRHVSKVLKLNRGDQVSYTDGLGRMGTGRLQNHALERGDEQEVSRPSRLVVAVAPPTAKERQRFLVEKLAEMGVARLMWLETRHGKERAASGQKLFAWVLSAVEQSRGAWLMETSSETVRWAELEAPVVACHPGGDPRTPSAGTVVIGPEGGFAEDEIPADVTRWDLGPTILRIETAAVVAAARLIAADIAR